MNDLPMLRSMPRANQTSEPVLQVRNLSKCYQIYNHPRDRLLQAFWGQKRQFYRPFWALQDVSFNLAPGRTLGVVGRNGSGKSTLLQLICGTLTPTGGTAVTRGRIGALLELGSGFNPEFSGRENVYLNATLLGLSRRETRERLDEILAFADIGDFIDQPVKTYSSGMAVRLAFAVQAHIEPEILVVDEALAVGDEMFQRKCYSHLEKLKAQGTSILLVSHSCPQILQHCDEALLLHGGRLRLHGDPKTVTTLYQRLGQAPAEEWEALLERYEAGEQEAYEEPGADAPGAEATSSLDPTLVPPSVMRYETHGAEIERLEVLGAHGQLANLLPWGEPLSVQVHCRFERDLDDLVVGCNIAGHTGLRISGRRHPPPMGGQGLTVRTGERLVLRFPFHAGLMPGLYFLGAGLWRVAAPGQFLHRVVDACAIRIEASGACSSFGLCDLSAGAPEVERLPPS